MARPARKLELDHKVEQSEVVAEFRALIEEARLKQKLSQNDIARRMGVSAAQVSKALNPDIANPTIETLVKIALAVNRRVQIRLR